MLRQNKHALTIKGHFYKFDFTYAFGLGPGEDISIFQMVNVPNF